MFNVYMQPYGYDRPLTPPHFLFRPVMICPSERLRSLSRCCIGSFSQGMDVQLNQCTILVLLLSTQFLTRPMAFKCFQSQSN